MRHRSWPVRASGALSVLAAVGAAASIAVAGQGRAAAAGGAQAAEEPNAASRPAVGHPDLQGFRTNQTYTPLQRPDGVTKAFYTEECGGRTR